MQCTVRFTVYFTFNLLEKIQVLIQVKIIIKAEYMNSNYNAVRTFRKKNQKEYLGGLFLT